MSNAINTAFIFAGGGSLGAVQVGMLKALLAADVSADIVSGVSVGSINAYCYACNPTAAGIAALEKIWCGLRRRDVFPAPGLWGALQIARGRGHLLSPERLQRLLEQQLPARVIEAAQLPCYIVATDALSGTAVTLNSGEVVPALLASAAIPAIFPPVQLAGRQLIDGGFAYQAPFEAALGAGATRLYVLPTGYSCARKQAPGSATGRAMSALNMLIISKLIGSIHYYSKQFDVRVVPPLCPLDVSPLDFSRTQELIERSAVQTRDWLNNGTEMEDGLPHQLAPHVH
jgi:NTE family protein